MATSPITPTVYNGTTDFHGDENEDRSEDDGDETMGDGNMTMAHLDGSATAHSLSNGKPYLFPDEPTNYSLFSNPPKLGVMRQRLFDVEDKIELSPSDFEAYFPFVDNVWRKCRSGDVQKEKNISTDWYWCRLRKPAGFKPHTPRPTPEGKKGRKKRVKEDVICGMSLKVIRNEGLVKSCTIVRGVAADMRHNHDMDFMDQQKRNGAIMDVARREAVRGFLPASIYGKMWEEQDKMLEAGGKFMKVSDVRNVQYQWRQENPNVVLKAHTGYTQIRSGPKVRFTEDMIDPHETPVRPDPPPQATELPAGTLQYPQEARQFLEHYLPKPAVQSHPNTPHVTLTYASSLDSRIALMPGVQTAISGPETKAMTHYLRSRHDAILIGVRTAIADDPSLNCRLAGAGGYGGIGWAQQPRPIIVDPHARLHIRPDMKMLKIISEGRARAPWIVVAPGAMLHPVAVSILKAHGGEYLMINDFQQQGLGLNWDGLFQILYKEGIRSIMVEGGGIVLSELLRQQYGNLIDSVIITIAPTFMGKTGVQVSPDTSFDHQGKPIASRLQQITWQPMGEEDVVFCGKVKPDGQRSQTNGVLSGVENFSQRAGDTATTAPTAAAPPVQRPTAGNDLVLPHPRP